MKSHERRGPHDPRHGVTVNVLPPGPAWFDQGPQPASDPGAQEAPAGQALAIAL